MWPCSYSKNLHFSYTCLFFWSLMFASVLIGWNIYVMAIRLHSCLLVKIIPFNLLNYQLLLYTTITYNDSITLAVTLTVIMP